MIPIDSHKQCITQSLHFTSFQILNFPLQKDSPLLPILNFHFQNIILIFSDGPFIFNIKFCCCHQLMTVQTSQISHILINDSGSGSSMLNFWMTTDIICWTEYTIEMFHMLLILILGDVDVVIVKTTQLIIHTVMIKGSTDDSKSFHDGKHVGLLQLPLTNEVIYKVSSGSRNGALGSDKVMKIMTTIPHHASH